MSRATQRGWFLVLLLISSATSAADEVAVSFDRQVRPLLARRCGKCHGADERGRKADLRLDIRESLLDLQLIRPGDPEGSGLWQRVVSDDGDEVMPPPGKGERLSEAEAGLLRRWIAQGANYEGHWSFEAPRAPELPAADTVAAGAAGPIDALVARELGRRGMRMAGEADPETWLRRVTVALTGLPPSEGDMSDFEERLERSPEAARAMVVDRLLASPAHGGHLARHWLDAARYADTYGRHEDEDSPVWPYRDWVIRAFQEHMPYDEFITRQTAADLMPGATSEDLVATCFNRLPQQSNEAGSDEEEFRIDQVNDRVSTNATVFLGLTMECARCHDHKFDPLTMRDYYAMSAFFNNINELGLFSVFTGAVPPPSVLLYDEDQQRRVRELEGAASALEADLAGMRQAARGRFEEWLKTARPPVTERAAGAWGRLTGWFRAAPPPRAEPARPEARITFDGMDNKELANEGSAGEPATVKLLTKLVEGRSGRALELTGDNQVMVNGVGEVRRHEAFSMALWLNPAEEMERAVVAHRSRAGIDAASRGFELILDGMRPSFALAHFSPGNEIRVRAREALPVGSWTHVACVYEGSSRAAGLRIFINGRPAATEVVSDKLYKDIVYRDDWGDKDDKDGVALTLTLGGRHNDSSFRNGLVDDFVFYRHELSAPEVARLALMDEGDDQSQWFEWYLREVDGPWREVSGRLTVARAGLNDLSGEAREVMVMEEMAVKRPTHVLERGQFDQPGERVEAGTPAFLPPFPANAPRNRLGFARWLVSESNPLTARVAANRFWQVFFGRGLVESAGDFGMQGGAPEHQELLDWLAVSFRDSGWDVGRLCREIALSRVFGQSSMPAEPGWLEADPDNALLARGPRRRMSAEELRDGILAASGLLCRKTGGPSVKPYQPKGLWDEAGTQHTYRQDKGENLYRRSLFSFWRRTLPPANMTVFDAPSREFCTVSRETTATPLQALALLNDVQLLEAARNLAAGLLDVPDARRRAEKAFRALTSRRCGESQAGLLAEFFETEKRRFEGNPEAAEALLAATGDSPLPARYSAPDLAAATLMVRLLLGFSETTFLP